MATKFKINERGVDNIIDDGKDYLRDIAEELRDEMKKLAPVDSGKLRRSIKIRDDGDGLAVYSDAEYAKVVEYGTRDQPAQPYMRPAITRVDSRHSE